MTDEFPFRSVLESHPEHVRAIGMISIELANLELFMGHMLGALIGIDTQLGQIIYLTPRTGIGRIEVLEHVMANLLPDGSAERKHLGSMLGRAKAIMSKRHELIHVVWAESQANPDEVHRMPIPIKHDPPKTTEVSVEYLTDMVRDIRVLIQDVQAETRRMGQARTAAALAPVFAQAATPPPSSPPKPSEPPAS